MQGENSKNHLSSSGGSEGPPQGALGVERFVELAFSESLVDVLKKGVDNNLLELVRDIWSIMSAKCNKKKRGVDCDKFLKDYTGICSWLAGQASKQPANSPLVQLYNDLFKQPLKERLYNVQEELKRAEGERDKWCLGGKTLAPIAICALPLFSQFYLWTRYSSTLGANAPSYLDLAVITAGATTSVLPALLCIDKTLKIRAKRRELESTKKILKDIEASKCSEKVLETVVRISGTRETGKN